MDLSILSKGAITRIERIKELRPKLTDDQIIENAITTYWLALERRSEKTGRIADRAPSVQSI